MKIQVNITTSSDDVNRFPTRQSLLDHIAGFDGLELMWFGDNDLITPDMVVGVHLTCRFTWYDFWIGDEERLLAEYDDLATVESVFGSLDPHTLVDELKENVRVAHRYGAEYVVFHVSDVQTTESTHFKFKRSNEEIIRASADLLNEVFAEEDGSIALMMENLWCPGLTLVDPCETRLLLDSIDYPNKGIMFDTGHLIHTDFSLASQQEGLAYVNRRLDEHERAGLLRYFRGMHLQQSITGDYYRYLIDNPIQWAPTYYDRMGQVFECAFKIDKHEPFICEGVRDMINRLPLEYLTFEFITTSVEQHAGYLEAQRRAIGMP